MRILMTTAFAALALCAASAGIGHAQDNNCPVTVTTSTGPNGETITRREACGAVEITSTGGRPPAAPPANTSSTRTNTTNTNTTTSNSDSRTRTQTETRTTTTTSPGRTETSSRTTSSTITTPSASSSLPPVTVGGDNWRVQVGGNVHDNDDFDVMTPPADFARIVLFDRSNFRGRSIGITQDTPNLAQRRFIGLASAARVQAGVWELCSEPNYAGTCVIAGSSLDLSATALNDTVASVRRVRR